MQIKRFLTLNLIGAMILASPAFANTASTQDFVTTASIANEFEIQASQLAIKTSQNSEVKNFARQMVDDHSKTGEQMKQALSTSKSGAQPATGLDMKHQKMLEKLQSSSGESFDQQYIQMQTQAHKDAVKLFESYSKNGEDPAMKQFAGQTLPSLEKHLTHVQEIQVTKK